MQLFPQIRISKKKALFLASGLIFLAGITIFLLWGGQEAPVSPHPNSQGEPELPKPVFIGNAEEEKPELAPVEAEYLNFPAGNMKKVTELLAALRETRLEVAIKEELAKLNKSQSPLPLTFPREAPQALLPALPLESAPDSEGSSSNLRPLIPQVLSIQGIDGNVAAIVQTPSGLRTLRVGDPFGEGRVESITVSGVRIRDGEGTQLISVEE